MKKRYSFFCPSITKDFILLYRVSIIGIFIAGLLFINFSINAEKRKIKESVFFASDQIKNLIDYNINYLEYQLHYAGKQIVETEAFKDKAKMQKLLSSFIPGNSRIDLYITWNSFSWIDKNNLLTVDGAAGIIKNPINLSERDYLYFTSKNPNKLYFGKLVNSALSNRIIVPVAVGIFSNQNQYLGTLVFGLDIERIVSRLNRSIGNETFSFVITNDKEIALHSDLVNDDDLLIAKGIAEESKNNNPDSQIRKLISSQDIFSKDKRFIAFQNIKNSPLRIIVFYNKDKSFEQISNVFIRNLLFILLAVFFCAILFQRIYSRIVKPVSELSRLALRISKKDFSFHIAKPASKELLNLYYTINLVKDSFQKEDELTKELNIATKELRKANLAKDRLLYSISHDIKNYVFGIEGLGRMVLNKNNELKTLSEEDLQNIETICEQTEELRYFVEDLLDQNHVEAGELGLGQLKPTDLKALINVVLLLNQRLITAHKAIVKTDFEEHLPRLLCDPRRMKQILLNLITNAVKYNRPHGEILITTKYLSNQIYLEIADQGFGMNEEEVKKYLSGNGSEINKSEISQVKEIDSHGIGMPIVLNLLKLHNGRIEVESEKGIGTKIKLYFNADKQINENNKLKPKKNKSILLVDDNSVNLKITTKILTNDGYDVLCANNGLEALEIIDQSPIDLILMDGEMPIMDGYETTKTIRQGLNSKGLPFVNFRHYQTIPIIAFMASSSSEIIAKAKNAGMNNHLAKGTNKEDILGMVGEFVG